MTFLSYASGLQQVLAEALESGLAVAAELGEQPKAATLGYVRGVIQFLDDSQLHFREYVDAALPEPRLMYVYHYQSADGTLIFRYDNAAHRPPLPEPAHKHVSEGVQLAKAPPLEGVVREIVRLLPLSQARR